MNLTDLAETKRILREGVEKGYWTVEHLDRPSFGFKDCTSVSRTHFKDGYQGVQFRNLLRDGAPVAERVQVIDDRDLPPMAHGITPAQTTDLPLAEPPDFSDGPF